MISIGFAIASLSFVTFVVEVVLALKQQASRPSAWIRKLALDVRRGFHRLGTSVGLLADVISGARRLVQQLRQWFFHRIPVDVMFTAIRDLLHPLVDLLRAPLAFVEGLNQSFRQSALPLITRVVFTVQFAGLVVLWQLLAMMGDWTIVRPSFLVGKGCVALGQLCYTLGYWIVTMADWSRFYAIMGHFVETYAYPWFRKGIFTEVLQDLATGLAAMQQVPKAFGLGAQEAFGLSTNQAVTILVISFGILAGLWGLYIKFSTKPKKVEKAKDEDDSGAGVLT